MLGRIPFGVPWTELVLSMALLVLFFLFLHMARREDIPHRHTDVWKERIVERNDEMGFQKEAELLTNLAVKETN
jgi:hypothetical protein